MTRLDVFGLGNGIVDTISFIEDSFLEKLPFSLPRGVMTLSDSKKQDIILRALKESSYAVEMRSGGSAANTIWALMLCGAKTCYSCKLGKDSQGAFYLREFEKSGIAFPVPPLEHSHGPTGTCIVLTTPDTQRTMSTYLGLSTELGPDDIDIELLRSARYVYCEGYLWTGEKTRAACLKAMEEAKKAGIPVAFSCSDPFVVKNYRSDFKKIIEEENYCDIVFCNLEEALALYEVEKVEDCLAHTKKGNKTFFISHSKEGCFVSYDQKDRRVPGFSVKAIDSNGAGDAFAGGALFALLQGASPFNAARFANYLGSEVVSIAGARLPKEKNYEQKYKELLSS